MLTLNIEVQLFDAKCSTKITLEVFHIKVSTFNPGWLVKGRYQSIGRFGLDYLQSYKLVYISYQVSIDSFSANLSTRLR